MGIETDSRIDRAAGAVDRLRAAVRLQRVAEEEQLSAIADLAVHHEWTTADELDVIGERAVRIGADGTPLVGEFLPLEVAAATGTSVDAATWLIRDVLDLQARHPVLWRSVQSGAVASRQAFQLVRLVNRYELSADEAAAVDERLTSRYGRIGWPRLLRLARGLIAQVAADKVQAAVERARSARFVTMAAGAEPLVTELWARLDSADARQLEASIQAIAATLKRTGDSDELSVRRSRALGILATPARAMALLQGEDDQRYLPRTTVYLHLTPDLLSSTPADASRPDAAVVRSEGLGPITKAQLADLFGTTRVTVTPVLHAGGDEAVDAYEVPNRIRAAVTLRDVVEPFPYSSRSARGLDLDHTEPYVPGGRAQTRPSNLGPLRRRIHRAKTAKRWQLRQPRAGTFWWTSPTGNEYRVTPTKTTDLHDHSTIERALTWLLDSAVSPVP